LKLTLTGWTLSRVAIAYRNNTAVLGGIAQATEHLVGRWFSMSPSPGIRKEPDDEV
jgi:hypothetical protein